jgi:nicotinamidase-related amidase
VITGEPDLLIAKHVNSAFYGEPDLHQWLRRSQIHRLVIAGITTAPASPWRANAVFQACGIPEKAARCGAFSRLGW